MNDLLSVIVPVYQDAASLPQTLQAILGQTYTNLEVLLINDGSQDQSLEVCQAAAAKDTRVRVLTKEHGGASAARNLGLHEAKGKYIAFVDADDCIDARMYEAMLAVMKRQHADIVNCRMVRETAYMPTAYTEKSVTVSDQPLTCLTKRGCSINSILNKVFTRDVIGDTHFDDTISFLEDKLFVTMAFFNAHKVAFVDNVFYHYLQHEDGLSWQDTFATWDGNFSVNERIYWRMKESVKAGTDLEQAAYRNYIRSVLDLLRYAVKHRERDLYEETRSSYGWDLMQFLQGQKLGFFKKLEYQTYTSSYFLASLFHYHFGKKKLLVSRKGRE